MEDQLEDDTGGVSWSVHLSQTADISVTTAASFISVAGGIVTFAPTSATVAGVHTFDITQSKTGCTDRITPLSITVTVPACSSKTWKPPTGNPVSAV